MTWRCCLLSFFSCLFIGKFAWKTFLVHADVCNRVGLANRLHFYPCKSPRIELRAWKLITLFLHIYIATIVRMMNVMLTSLFLFKILWNVDKLVWDNLLAHIKIHRVCRSYSCTLSGAWLGVHLRTNIKKTCAQRFNPLRSNNQHNWGGHIWPFSELNNLNDDDGE